MSILKVLKNKEGKNPVKKSKKPAADIKPVVAKTVPPTNRAFVGYLMKKPWISEKAARLTAENQYVFEVVKNANKNSVKKEVENRYGVKVERVNIINRPAKTKKFGGKISVGAVIKKAVVKLKPGHKIEIL